jgi:hypothetical protein
LRAALNSTDTLRTMELAGRLTAGLCEPERLSGVTRVPDWTVQDELIMRGRRPCPPGRGGGAAAVRGEGRFKEVEKTCDKSVLFRIVSG